MSANKAFPQATPERLGVAFAGGLVARPGSANHFTAPQDLRVAARPHTESKARPTHDSPSLGQTTAPAAQPKFHWDIRANFARAFRLWRRKNKVPLKQIAADLGVGISTIGSWELGERFPSADHFVKLVSYTDLPPCRLLCAMADTCVPHECRLADGATLAGAPAE